MSDKIRESMSALVDGEANEMDLHRVLKATSEDAESRQVWQRYQTVSAVLNQADIGLVHIDIAQRVKEQLADSEASNAQRVVQFFKPMASLAVAATVTVAVLTGTQIYHVTQGGNAGGVQVAASDSFNSAAPVVAGQFSNLALPAAASSEAYRKPAPAQLDKRKYADAIAEQRLEAYLQQHVETSSLNNGLSVMPFARIQPAAGTSIVEGQ